MKRGFYLKLAWNGISKNRKIYIPYLLTCVLMIAICFLTTALCHDPEVRTIKGGDSLQAMLQMGSHIIVIFAAIFLFYTSSFLIKRRKKEFGLYNILGMGKRNIARIMLWETVMVMGISFAVGLVCGVLFSKVGQLIMIRILGGETSFSFPISIEAIVYTVLCFGVIFFLILLNNLRQVHTSNPIELFRSDNVGEKPPRANYVFALAGLILLGVAYYLALTIEEPMKALLWFMVAVVLVIIATYLLFVSGSVAFLKLLRRNKKYYYNTKHFVSTSSMVYRMKRNGAGLASICILCTMVLVTISTTACLYIGVEENLTAQYPRQIAVNSQSLEEYNTQDVRDMVDHVVAEKGLNTNNILEFRYLYFTGYKMPDQIVLDQEKLEEYEESYDAFNGYANLRQLLFLPLEDYNALTGENKTLSEGEVLFYSNREAYEDNNITVEGKTFTIKELLPELEIEGLRGSDIATTYYIVVPDMETVKEVYDLQFEVYGGVASLMQYYYAFDTNGDEEAQVSLWEALIDEMSLAREADESFPTVWAYSIVLERQDFYGLYGGLLFLGVLLGIIFLMAAVLIVYYKQITEGYEDQSRFDILQKVGMTRKEIRKSINSQVLTVFFLPLIVAGIHILVAFKIISKMLALFQLYNTTLLILVTIGCFVLFAIFYIFVYVMTSRVYYGIVSGRQKA